jgi:hypothetical protein
LEPKVKTEMVADRLKRRIDAETERGEGESVTNIAEDAQCSPRTVYRVLQVRRPFISLDLADRLLLAIDEMLEPSMLDFTDARQPA